MNRKIEQILEFQKIRQKLAHYANSDLGKIGLLKLEVASDPITVRHMIRETAEGVLLLRVKNGIPIPHLRDIRPHMKRLEAEASLNGRELSEVLKSLETSKEVLQYLVRVREDEIQIESLWKWGKKLVLIPDVTKELAHAITEDGRIRDDASTALKGIRQGIQKAEQTIRQELDAYLSHKTAYLSDQIITIRNNRYVLPVKAEYRNSFGGIVHDQSSSGQTLFMEPQSVVNLNNRLSELQSQEKAEEERILIELSLLVAPHTKELLNNHEILAHLDGIHAKALYAREIKATEPRVHEGQTVKIIGARHPLLDPNIVVSNDISLGEDYQAIVITGPNTGGKTIYLKTLGIIQLMGQSGLFIPAEEGSQIGVFQEIFADIGDEQSIEQNLSTFSSHMSSIVSILNQMNQHSLVLLDEVGSGTDPKEGAALAISILDYIASKQASVVATTHYPELKAYGYERTGTINASMEFDEESLQPTYRLLMGIPGRSNALDISKRLGLPEEIILESKALLTEESHELNQMIADLVQQRRRAEQEALELEEQLAESQQLLLDLRQEAEQYQKNKQRLMDEAKAKANDLIQESQEAAEKIMSEIRDLQLKGQQAVIKEHELIEKRTAMASLKHEESLKKNRILRREKEKKAMESGQTVNVLSYGQEGVLLEKVSDYEWVVQIGRIKMKLPTSDLAIVEPTSPPRKSTVILRSANASHVKNELDIRGRRYEDGMKDLEQFLDAALLAGYPRVTIIHGRGTGALQKGVHKLLKTHRSVARYEYAPMNMGGNGATIVTFQ